jgi:hypothetical protein
VDEIDDCVLTTEYVTLVLRIRTQSADLTLNNFQGGVALFFYCGGGERFEELRFVSILNSHILCGSLPR